MSRGEKKFKRVAFRFVYEENRPQRPMSRGRGCNVSLSPPEAERRSRALRVDPWTRGDRLAVWVPLAPSSILERAVVSRKFETIRQKVHIKTIHRILWPAFDNPLEKATKMTTTTLHFRVRDTCSGALKFIPRFFRPHKTPPSRGTQSERGIMPSCDALIPYQSQSLPPQLDLSPFNDPNAPPERFVDAVQNLKKYLPSECGFLGQGDLKIIGPHPIDAGGFADVWVGEWNGTTVAVKSFRPYTSTNFLTIYSVSGKCSCGAFSPFNIFCRNCIGKRWRATSLTTVTRASCRSLGFTPLLNTRFASFSSSWAVVISESTYGVTPTLGSWTL